MVKLKRRNIKRFKDANKKHKILVLCNKENLLGKKYGLESKSSYMDWWVRLDVEGWPSTTHLGGPMKPMFLLAKVVVMSDKDNGKANVPNVDF